MHTPYDRDALGQGFPTGSAAFRLFLVAQVVIPNPPLMHAAYYRAPQRSLGLARISARAVSSSRTRQDQPRPPAPAACVAPRRRQGPAGTQIHIGIPGAVIVDCPTGRSAQTRSRSPSCRIRRGAGGGSKLTARSVSRARAQAAILQHVLQVVERLEEDERARHDLEQRHLVVILEEDERARHDLEQRHLVVILEEDERVRRRGGTWYTARAPREPSALVTEGIPVVRYL